ncbi:hypothetical protein FA95DRAFT_684484 [Auriscalpium vulgare]|uniref:Uncharacterized protein n=1 Tax=Auriscalpium vulgare TaxID=40419 RepID=A0ACB8S1W3_9AGAM|nr:hypothetical protein FA95DRAFT_684484 [Auriscalpium vulgare]
MTRLAKAVDRVEELTNSAAEDQCPPLVPELRATLRKHEDRYREFVQLSKEYADRYLQDLSDEIRSQSAWLDLLERRLDLAKTRRRDTLDLKTSFDKDVWDELKVVHSAVRHCPLVEEAAVFKELKELVGKIQECYVELDKFWSGEVRHVTQMLKDSRMETVDRDRWRDIGEGIKRALVENETTSQPHTQSEVPVRANAGPYQQFDVGKIASVILPVISAAKRTISSARTFAREMFSVLTAKHLRHVAAAYVNIERHKDRCVRFLKTNIAYAQTVVNTMVPRPSYVRIAAAIDLRAKAAALTAAGSIGLACSGINALTHNSAPTEKAVRKSLQKVEKRLREGERIWNAILGQNTHVFAALLSSETDNYGGCSLKKLKETLRVVDKEHDLLSSRLILATRV